MIILGLHPVTHDVSAALVIDGKVVAAADEERFTRKKHGFGQLPVHAAAYCLKEAGIEPKDVELVAFPWSRDAILAHRWRYLRHTLRRRPTKALRSALDPLRRQKKREKKLERSLATLGITNAEVVPVEHHLAHAASAFYCSGFERAAIATLDGVGELATTLFAVGEGRDIKKLHEVYKPDSLGHFYSTMTEFLGFSALNGEYKLMGMAPYGDASKVDVSRLLRFANGTYRIHRDYVDTSRRSGWRGKSLFSDALVEMLGPPREGSAIEAPYTDIAAATQALFERCSLHLIEHHLGDVLRETGKLCLAGGCALNVVLNRKLTEHPLVDELFVQPNAGDGGTSLGAALYVAAQRGEPIVPGEQVYLGPAYGKEDCRAALERFRIPFEEPGDMPATVAALLAAGNPVAWYQGRMEWGPRALGNRSILGHPAHKGMTQDINKRIKFRETWRPFCPSVLAEHGPDIFDNAHDAPHMTVTFGVKKAWQEKLTEITHVDGSARPQYVRAEQNPRFRKVIEEFYKRTDVPCVINTSLNRRGEPIVCTPEDCLAMFHGSGVEFLALGDFLVRKRALPEGVAL